MGRKLLALLLGAFLLRMAILPLFWHQPLNIVDEQHYSRLAISILTRGEFAHFPGKPTAIRPPLYPVFLAGIYKIFGPKNYDAVRIIQIFLALLSGCVVYSLTKKFFEKENVALLACAIFLFYPSLLFFNYLILTETLFIFLFLLALWGLSLTIFNLSLETSAKYQQNKFQIKDFRKRIYKSYLIPAGIFWGLASLTRSILYPFIPAVSLFLFWITPRRRQGLLVSLLFLLTAILTLSPWMVRNYRIFGHFVAVDTMGGLNLYMGNYEHTPLHRAWAAVENPPEIAWYRGHEKELSGLNEAEKQRWAIKKALEFIREHPGLTVVRSLIKIANFWQLERTIVAGIQKNYFPKFQNKFLILASTLSILVAYIAVVILGFNGLFWVIFYEKDFKEKNNSQKQLIKKSIKSKAVHLFLFLLIIYFTAIHGVVFGHSRYHLPLIPILCIYTAYFLSSFKNIWKNKRYIFWKLCIPIFAIFLLFWSYDIFIGSREKIETFTRHLFK